MISRAIADFYFKPEISRKLTACFVVNVVSHVLVRNLEEISPLRDVLVIVVDDAEGNRKSARAAQSRQKALAAYVRFRGSNPSLSKRCCDILLFW